MGNLPRDASRAPGDRSDRADRRSGNGASCATTNRAFASSGPRMMRQRAKAVTKCQEELLIMVELPSNQSYFRCILGGAVLLPDNHRGLANTDLLRRVSQERDDVF